MRENLVKIVCFMVAVVLLAACASIGRPQGGERDELPPVFVHSDPAPGSLNFKGNRLSIYFDENIKMEDVMNKVVVSPVQKTPPSVIANGKRLSVEFRDTLVPDATYTIDFSDAIRDLNEGNILDGFAIDFSTGDKRDSLVIAGMLFEARNLEPAQGMIVGVYSNLSDTAITTLPFDRIAKTNQYGQFVLRNLAPGTYNLYAVNDLNRDYHWDRSEDVAFLGETVVPEVTGITVTDTLRASNGMDSIVMRQGVRYLPNDLLLTWFNENYRSQYLKNHTRIDSTRITIEFGAPTDSLPEITLLNTPAAGRRLDEIARMDYSAAGDSITYWLTDRDVIATDTLHVAMRYLRTDTLDQLSWTTDTLRLLNRESSRFHKELDKRNKDREKLRKKLQEAGRDTIFTDKPAFITFEPSTRSNQELNRPLYITASQPLDTIYQDRIHLEMRVDTVWVDARPGAVARDSVNRQMRYVLDHKWKEGERYRLTIDSAAVTGIYGNVNEGSKIEFTVKSLEDYSNIRFKLSGIPEGEEMVVELLNAQDRPVATAPAIDGTATFTFVSPGTYYARAFVDTNRNGVWDTGNIAEKRQAEDVYYYSKKLALKKNWDLDQSWDLNELPIEAQKPEAIKKNKPKNRDRNNRNSSSDYDDEEEDDDDLYYPGRGSSGRNNGNNPFSGFGGPQGVQNVPTLRR
ncbi:MAG: Ig-like domain-containing protein [Barnesiella sp.]|nr:Ig-like domain-containing protein [Bacteroidales bacterium]MBD5247522.1 Ig-like domain-containing protein [Barnesiella sp.]